MLIPEARGRAHFQKELVVVNSQQQNAAELPGKCPGLSLRLGGMVEKSMNFESQPIALNPVT